MFRTTALIIVLSASVISTMATISNPSDETLVIAGRTDSRSTQPDLEAVSVSIEPVTAEPASAPAPSVLTADEQTLVDWARGRFTEAGLELPEISVTFDPTRELCKNNEGLYRREAGVNLVFVCTRDSDSFAAQLERRRTLLHEFGHVWDTVNLTDADRDHYAEHLGADGWYDQDHAWDERGVERFAETFVFALLDQSARQLKVSVDCDSLIDVFANATGGAPLGPGLPPCAAGAADG